MLDSLTNTAIERTPNYISALSGIASSHLNKTAACSECLSTPITQSSLTTGLAEGDRGRPRIAWINNLLHGTALVGVGLVNGARNRRHYVKRASVILP